MGYYHFLVNLLEIFFLAESSSSIDAFISSLLSARHIQTEWMHPLINTSPIFQIPPTVQGRFGKHGAFAKERLSDNSSVTNSPKSDFNKHYWCYKFTKEWLKEISSVANSLSNTFTEERQSKTSSVINSSKSDWIYHFIANMNICVQHKILETISWFHMQYGCKIQLSWKLKSKYEMQLLVHGY